MVMRSYTPAEAAEPLGFDEEDVVVLLKRGLFRGSCTDGSWRVTEEEIERIRALQKRGVSFPTRKNALDFTVIRQALGEAIHSLPNLLERDRANRKLAANRELRAILTIQVRVVEQTSVLLLRLLDEKESTSREESFVALSPLVRTLLESVFTFGFLLEDPGPRVAFFLKGGWWNARREYERYRDEFGSSASAGPFLKMLSSSLEILEDQVRPSAEDRARKPQRGDYWPNPGTLKRDVQDTNLRTFMEYLDAWMYGDLSSASHLSLIGVRNAGAYLRSLDDPEVRDLVILKTRSEIAFRVIGLTLAAYSEIEVGLGGLDSLLRRKLLEVWQQVVPYQKEIRDLFELRYQAALSKA
jgi:hypothetical protein